MPNKFTDNFHHFESPLELLVLYDEDVLSEKVILHDWQRRFLTKFSRSITDGENLQQALIAANGSGKSQFILAPCIVWMAISFDNCLSYVTSSSAEQLDTQTERYVDAICERMCVVHKEEFKGLPVWDKLIRRHKHFGPTNSHIDLLATDEKYRAEGKHPLRPGAEFLIVADEAKGITEEIFTALDRCTGFSRKVYSSSPGECRGEFYKVATAKVNTIENDTFDTPNELGWNVLKVTAFECPHIKQHEIQQIIRKHGLHDPLVRSSIFAEFCSVGEDKTCLTYDNITKCIEAGLTGKITKVSDKLKFGFHAGLDLSGGGDEQVFSAWIGNEEIGLETARIRNFSQLKFQIIDWLHKYKSYGACWEQGKSNIWGDDGGMGWAILGALEGEETDFISNRFYINRVLNQHRAFDSIRYGNRGSEMWFNFKRYVEEFQIILLPDKESESQMSSRYYKIQPVTNKIILESKEEARRKGHPSPDRADARVLAWGRYIYPFDYLTENLIPGQAKALTTLQTGQYNNLLSLEKALRDKQLNRGERIVKEPEGLVTQSDIAERLVSSSSGLQTARSNESFFGTRIATMNNIRRKMLASRKRFY